MCRIPGSNATRRWNWTLGAGILLCVFAIFVQPSAAAFNVTLNGVTRSIPAVQLWYDGYWTKVDWVNGSTKIWPSTNGTVQGHIVLLKSGFAELRVIERTLRELAPLKPLAAIVAVNTKDGLGSLGSVMYFRCDGQDRKPINYPVVHANFAPDFDWSSLRDETYLEVQFEENPWLIAHGTHFQAVIGALLSLWEAILVICGAVRLYQFFRSAESYHVIFSVGPMCLLLELISCSIRFAHVSVDPIWNDRVYPDSVHLGLVSIHLPFSYAAGILLTFFWAEILNKSKFKATPFIAKYKKLSFSIITAIFVIEITATTLRVTTTGTVYNVFVLVSLFLYISVAIALAVSFLLCFVAIYGRLKNTKLRPQQTDIMTISIRFGFSILGYLGLCCFIIAIGVISLEVYATHLMYDMAHASLNFVATIQIVLLTPPSASNHKAWSSESHYPMTGSSKYNLTSSNTASTSLNTD